MNRIFGLFLILAAFAVFVSNEVTSAARDKDDFMRKAALSSMAEVALSNLALQRSQNEEVRRFAQMMVDDHTRANQELTTLAASENVTLPTALDGKHQSAMNKLQNLSGAAFDSAYMRQMVKDHEAAVKLFQKQANRTGDDAEVTAFAAKMLPALQGHLQMARSISGATNTTNRNANSTMNMNSGGNTNSDMNMNSGGNMNMNSNRNMNSNTNRNTNSNRNTNTNTNSNMNMNSNGNTNRNTNANRTNTNGNVNSNMQ